MAVTAPARQHQPEPEGEHDAIIASPLDPRVEHVRPSQSRNRPCHCPYAVAVNELGFAPEDQGLRIKILHAVGCTVRVAAGTPARERKRAGHPCSKCGEVAHMLADEQGVRLLPGLRRCWGCNHVWNPAEVGEEG